MEDDARVKDWSQVAPAAVASEAMPEIRRGGRRAIRVAVALAAAKDPIEAYDVLSALESLCVSIGERLDQLDPEDVGFVDDVRKMATPAEVEGRGEQRLGCFSVRQAYLNNGLIDDLKLLACPNCGRFLEVGGTCPDQPTFVELDSLDDEDDGQDQCPGVEEKP